jgi:hypothetical protein
MGCLLKLVTGGLLTIGALLWLTFLVQLFEKLVHPQQKNLSGEGFFIVGLVLTFLTAFIYLGFRSRSDERQQMRNDE